MFFSTKKSTKKSAKLKSFSLTKENQKLIKGGVLSWFVDKGLCSKRHL